MSIFESKIKNSDPFDQDDWQGYVDFTARIGQSTQVVGDDLLVTNPTRIQTALDKKACNALLLKVNQIGTLTESIKVKPLKINHFTPITAFDERFCHILVYYKPKHGM